MTDAFNSLLEALDITESSVRTTEDIFVAPSIWTPLGRVFGGQVLAQSLVAASRTIEGDRPAHSMHGYFLRPGDANQPITFSVDRIHDGRSFSTRRTQAYQNGVPILSMIASFQTDDPGLDHQIGMPEGLPDPESLPTTADVIGSLDHPVARSWAHERPFDVRHISQPVYLQADESRAAHQAVWVRAVSRLPDDPVLHRAALAYASDYSILEAVFRRHGLTWMTPGMKVASLDHAMWWHRPGRADEWVLYTQESPSATGGRGLALGRMFSRDGTLLASIAQEGTIRVPGV
ncbi:acyl-CoA thioesterase II [Subtercola boreus]|uniref:Acyl-CoA thioesterase 2 n=1 Tax=Subtercola boreus TaxID=120213 RepID=A0A3E0VY26_9MICO|nr:acyl-CoA thioesterase II [Subtercola boreus]RFA14630.1 acyl-CoA thioesterase II [Subtercola boreus]